MTTLNEQLLSIYESVYTQKKCLNFEKLDNVLNKIKTGEYNFEAISKARQIGNKNNKDYISLKENSKQIIWAYNSSNKLFTNLFYFDIDLDEDDDLDFAKKTISELPYTLAVWSSFGGRGLGCLFFCPNITSTIKFKQTHYAVYDYIFSQTGYKIDKKCSNYNRLNTLSFDSSLFFNKNAQPFTQIKVNFKKEKDFLKYKIDDSLFIDNNILDEILDVFQKNFYAKYIIINKLDNKPVKFLKNLKFDFEKHYVTKYVDAKIISQEGIKNKRNTLAYSDAGYSCIKFFLQEDTYFPRKKRVKSLCSFIFNLLITNHFNKFEITKNFIYNLLVILNSRCVNCKVEKGQKPIYDPLKDDELNKVSSFIFDIFQKKEISKTVDKCKTIRTSNFLPVFLQENPTYTGNQHIKSILLKEINNLKNNKTVNNHYTKISEILSNYEGCKAKEFIEIISIELKIEKSYARDLYYEYKKTLKNIALCEYNVIQSIDKVK